MLVEKVAPGAQVCAGRLVMNKFFFPFALLGLVIVAAWGWSRRHRREKGTLTSKLPSARSPVSPELKTLKPHDRTVAPTMQMLGTVQRADVVASAQSAGDPAVAGPSELHPILSRMEPSNITAEEAAESVPADSQGSAAERAT